MGGTETGNALETAYAIKSASGLPNELLLITDGQIADVEHVIARAEKSDHRIFTVGVGSAVAETFVRQLAENTGGACELVAPREDMAEKIHRHFQRMYMASANNIEVHWPVQPEQSLPETLKTIYTGDTLHVIGWFAEEPAGEVTLKIFLDDGQVLTERAMVQDAVNILLATTDELPSALARMCAARHLSTLEDSKAASDLSVRYQLMSRWADYLVICPLQENEKASDLPELRKVPHVVAAGWHGIGSVAAGSDRMIEIRESAFLSYDGLQFERANRPDTMRGLASLGRAETLDQPTDKSTSIQLIDRLNELSTRSLPNLDELEHWGVPVLVLKTMRDLVNHGVDEREVVATFLHLVADLDVNRTIGRYARRQILKSFKIHTTRASAAEILTDAISRCSDWSDGIRGNSRDASIASFMKLLRFKMKGLGR
jgi:Ca-activated chloride channel family protein